MSKTIPTLRRYVVQVREVFEDTYTVVANNHEEACRIAEDNWCPDMAGQELLSDVTADLPLEADDERKGSRIISEDELS